MAFRALASRTFETLRSAPLLFLIVQLPEAITDLVETYLEAHSATVPQWLIITLLPLFFSITSLAEALTFAVVLQREAGEQVSLRGALKKLEGKFGILIKCSLILGVAFLAGFCAMIVPGIYLMSLYLFVPHLILTEPPTSLSVYLFRSTQLAKRSFKIVIATVITAMSLYLLTLLLGNQLGSIVGRYIPHPIMSYVVSLLIDVLISMPMNAVLYVWVGLFFLSLKGRSP